MIFDGTILPASEQRGSVALTSAEEPCRIIFDGGVVMLEKARSSSPAWSLTIGQEDGPLVIVSVDPLVVEAGPCRVRLMTTWAQLRDAAASAGLPIARLGDVRRLEPDVRPSAGAETLDEPDDAGLFDEDDWIVVERHADPEAATMPDVFGDFAVSYGDGVAHFREELVERSVEVIQRFPGVTAAQHEDRELILVWGSPDLAALEQALRRWWAEQPT